MNVKMSFRLIGAAAVLLGGIAATTLWTRGAGVASTPSRCANFQLFMQPDGNQGAAGHIFQQFQIHDLLGTCTLDGYPGAELLSQTFRSMPTHVSRAPFPEGSHGPRLVNLSRKHPAFFVMQWTHIPAGNQPCPTARHVMLWAPQDVLPVVTYAQIDACGGKVTVSPVASKKYF